MAHALPAGVRVDIQLLRISEFWRGGCVKFVLGSAVNQVHTLGDVTTYVLQKKYLLTYVKSGRSADEVLTYLCKNSAASRPKYLLACVLAHM